MKIYIATRPYRLLLALGGPFFLFVLCKAVLFPPYDDTHAAFCRSGAASAAANPGDALPVKLARLRASPVYGPPAPERFLAEGRGRLCVCDWGPLPLKYAPFKWLALFSSLAFLGALGATVSYYWRMSGPASGGVTEGGADAASAPASGKRNILLLQMFGAVFAVALFLMFLSGIINGSVFPRIDAAASWCNPAVDMKAWSGLLFWAFVSGFSERVVPGLIDKLADKLDGDDDSAPLIKEPRGGAS